MTGTLQHQAWMIAPETRKVMDALLDDGGDARFVGGCVRNALCNRNIVDIDIATPLPPEQVIERLARHDISYVPTGLKHGTVTAIVEGHPFEITTLRRDIATDGRHAEVAFTDDWRADASRRDFTFNAIFATAEGGLFDPFGGVEDLRNGRVRFVGDPATRIKEDYLRILRFFRFHAHFGRGAPEEAALNACAAAAPQLAHLSAERIRQEILKLLESPNAAATWRLMVQYGIIAHVLPAATNVAALEKLIRLEIQQHDDHPFPLRRLAALLEATAKDVPSIAQALRLSNDQAAQLNLMLGKPLTLAISASEVRKLVYRHGNDAVRSFLLLAAAKAEDTAPLAALYHEATVFRAPRFPLRGDDVLKTGVPPSPEVGRIMESIENWWIEQDFAPDRAACLAKLKPATGA